MIFLVLGDNDDLEKRLSGWEEEKRLFFKPGVALIEAEVAEDDDNPANGVRNTLLMMGKRKGAAAQMLLVMARGASWAGRVSPETLAWIQAADDETIDEGEADPNTGAAANADTLKNAAAQPTQPGGGGKRT